MACYVSYYELLQNIKGHNIKWKYNLNLSSENTEMIDYVYNFFNKEKEEYISYIDPNSKYYDEYHENTMEKINKHYEKQRQRFLKYIIDKSEKDHDIIKWTVKHYTMENINTSIYICK